MAPFLNNKRPILREPIHPVAATAAGNGTGLNPAPPTGLNPMLGHLERFGNQLDWLRHVRRFRQPFQIPAATIRAPVEPVDLPRIDWIGRKRGSFVPGMSRRASDRAGTRGAAPRGRFGQIAGRRCGGVAGVLVRPSPLGLPSTAPFFQPDDDPSQLEVFPAQGGDRLFQKLEASFRRPTVVPVNDYQFCHALWADTVAPSRD